MFGRRKRSTDEELVASPATPDEREDDELDDELDDVDDDDLDEDEDDDELVPDTEELDADLDEVDHDLRDDGPFDISEVDLDADDIDRLDFGAVVLTPFDGMQVQLQVDQATNQVQSALVMYERSALEVALFAAPASTSMVADVAQAIMAAALEQDGAAELADGPFGDEVRREIPVIGEDGEQQGLHISRTWLTQGPRWLLRGVLMGEAALPDGPAADTAELFLEFYRNIVVRRHDAPMVPGDVIAMTLPEAMLAEAEGTEGR
ncbi:DUF3710 domain-containing protein [Aestuariimicrobium ganziense]|uniref:DUF3710 domain-containing protein n=1 Tax=Aestuariimicrobium ganziense TaxID=2773677 RepID=UPI001944121D